MVGKNLSTQDFAPGEPWAWSPSAEDLDRVRKLRKDDRRSWLLRPTSQWNVYTAVIPQNPSQRVSRTNIPQAIVAFVADFDMVADLQTIQGYLNQMSPELQPNLLEQSLSGKWRLHWLFARAVLVNSFEMASVVLETFCDKLKAATLLAGFDAASLRPSEVWTNGGVWYDFKKEPLSWEVCFGILCDVSRRKGDSLFGRAEIPLEVVGEKVKETFPGRWQGEFKLDAIGVRFWDPSADCPTGCQVKPDGMLCFTGNQSFVPWSQLFGQAWVDEQRALNLGRAAKDIYFDGDLYWTLIGSIWCSVTRQDIQLELRRRGLSDKKARGQTLSELERVLCHIQQENRVTGAAPLPSLRPGPLIFDNRRVLNTSDLTFVVPKQGGPDQFPFIQRLLDNFFKQPPGMFPKEHFLGWLQRAVIAQTEYQQLMGQALVFCGPAQNGKSLICREIVAPLLGNRWANPYSYFTGLTEFNAELFHSTLLAIDDENAQDSLSSRSRFISKLKTFVVNEKHMYHAKFRTPVQVSWNGRICITLNNDATSIGLLPEVVEGTRDKLMFFESQDFVGKWPTNEEIKKLIAQELPYFCWWLLNDYKPSADIVVHDRCGIRSYFDPNVLRMSREQNPSYVFLELLKTWIHDSITWRDNGAPDWEGTPTELIRSIASTETLTFVSRGWDPASAGKALTALQRQGIVEYAEGRIGRVYTLNRDKILNA